MSILLIRNKDGVFEPVKTIGIADDGGNVSGERIAAAVEAYLRDHPVTGGAIPKKRTIQLLAANWVGEKSPYTQVVEIDCVTPCSQVDLTFSDENIEAMHDKDLTFTIKNQGGVVTVSATGEHKPQYDHTVQVTVTEVEI